MLTRSIRLLARRRVSPSVVSTSSSTTIPRADDIDRFPLRERQESLLLERLPSSMTTAEISEMTGLDSGKILLMRSTIGESTGRACLLMGPNEVLPPTVPGDVITRPLDIAETALFVEQCERYRNFTADIRRLAAEAKNNGFERTVTLTGIPKLYSRKDVKTLISEATKGSVVVADPRDIVFRFKKNGHQSDTCFVMLKTGDDALQVIKAVQEYPTPLRTVYGASFGCSFVHSDRSALFITDPSLDYQLDGSKCWVLTLGWNGELDAEQMRTVLTKMAIFPHKIESVNGGSGGEFLLKFDRMKNAKLVFTRLNRLKRRWRIPGHTPFFAYPVRADIHFADETEKGHADEASDCDSDLDEPVMY